MNQKRKINCEKISFPRKLYKKNLQRQYVCLVFLVKVSTFNSIMSPIQFLDDLIREYLLFRGFVNTLKLFDADVKAEKDKGLRSDK